MPPTVTPTTQGTPTDAYSGANAVLERQRAALLASMTQRMQDVAGTYTGAGTQADQARQAALAQMHQAQQTRGAPAAAQSQLDQIASAPYAEAGAYRSALAQGRDQFLHTAATGNDAYNREAGQAVPVLRAQTEQQRQQKYQQVLQEQDAARHAEEIRVAAEKRQTAHDTLTDFLQATHYQTQDRIAQQALDAQIAGMLRQEQQGQGLLDAQNAATAAASGGGGASGPVDVNGIKAMLSPLEQSIIGPESGFRVDAYNKINTSSGHAFGLGQITDQNRIALGRKLGIDPNTRDAGQQIAMFREYVRQRYGTIEAAVAHRKAKGWY